MPISEEEADRLISHIEMTVREIASDPPMPGITALIDQWKADVEAGRPVELKLPVHRRRGVDGLIDTSRSRPTTSGEFVGKEDYTKFEQLDMLIVSLYLAFLAPSTMSKRLLDTIEEFSGEPNQQEKPSAAVDLLGVASTDESPRFTHISRETIAQSNESTSKLASLLNEIVQEAGLAPRRFIDGEDIA